MFNIDDRLSFSGVIIDVFPDGYAVQIDTNGVVVKCRMSGKMRFKLSKTSGKNGKNLLIPGDSVTVCLNEHDLSQGVIVKKNRL